MHSRLSGPPRPIRSSLKSRDYANVFTGQDTSSRLIRSIPFGRLRIPLACQPEEDHSLTAAPRRLLIQPQHIPRRIPKPRRNLRGIRSDRLHNLSPVRHSTSSSVAATLSTMIYTSNPTSLIGGRPSTHDPLTSPAASSNATLSSPRLRMFHPNTFR